jgi:hypothetical protein
MVYVLISDGGACGTDVGGVGSQQTQDTGTNSIAPPWMTAAGWVANTVGGMTSPDGASHWGPRERPQFEVTNYRQDLRRAVQQREARTRRPNDETAAPTTKTQNARAQTPTTTKAQAGSAGQTRKTMISRRLAGSVNGRPGAPRDVDPTDT